MLIYMTGPADCPPLPSCTHSWNTTTRALPQYPKEIGLFPHLKSSGIEMYEQTLVSPKQRVTWRNSSPGHNLSFQNKQVQLGIVRLN